MKKCMIVLLTLLSVLPVSSFIFSERAQAEKLPEMNEATLRNLDRQKESGRIEQLSRSLTNLERKIDRLEDRLERLDDDFKELKRNSNSRSSSNLF